MSADDLLPLRRIVPAYRNPPGPQLLGRTLDYVGRLLDRSSESAAQGEATTLAAQSTDRGDDGEARFDGGGGPVGRLLDLLREQGLAVDRRRVDDPEPFDITRQPTRPGVPRSAQLHHGPSRDRRPGEPLVSQRPRS